MYAQVVPSIPASAYQPYSVMVVPPPPAVPPQLSTRGRALAGASPIRPLLVSPRPNGLASTGVGGLPVVGLPSPGRSHHQRHPHHHNGMFTNGITKPDVPTEGPTQLRKLFIGGLTHETTDEQLADYYSQWGVVVDCIVIRDPHTKQSRGFGFVTYSKVMETETSMKNRPHTINQKQVDPKRAIPREDMITWSSSFSLPSWLYPNEGDVKRQLYISGIHWDYHTVDNVKQYLETFGPLRQVEILGSPKGLAFAVFQDEASLLGATTERYHTIEGKRVEIAKADRHNEVPTFETIKPRGPRSANIGGTGAHHVPSSKSFVGSRQNHSPPTTMHRRSPPSQQNNDTAPSAEKKQTSPPQSAGDTAKQPIEQENKKPTSGAGDAPIKQQSPPTAVRGKNEGGKGTSAGAFPKTNKK